MTDAVIDTTAPVAAPAAPAPAPVAAPAVAALAPPAAPVAKPMPGKDAPAAEWTKYYELPVPEGMDGKFAEKASSWMAKAGATPEMARSIASEWNAHVAELTKAATDKTATDAAAAQVVKDAALKKDETALATEWGADAEKNKGIASRAYKEFLNPHAGEKSGEVVSAIENTIGFAATMKLMHAIGAKLGEAQPRGHGQDNSTQRNPGAGSHIEAAMRASIDAALKK